MAALLTQSYLLLGEEPLEKIGASSVGNKGTVINYGTKVSICNDLCSGLTCNEKSSEKCQTEISALPMVAAVENTNRLDFDSNSSDKNVPKNGEINSEIKKKSSPSTITSFDNEDISASKSLHFLSNNVLLKNESISKNNDRLFGKKAHNDATDSKLLLNNKTFVVYESGLVEQHTDEKIVDGQGLNSSEKCLQENVKSDKAEPLPVPVIYKWTNIVAIFSIHLLAVYGFGYMAWHWSTLSILFSFISGGLSGFGVTGGAHRLWTHRAYKATTPLQWVLLFCYTLAGQNTVYEWVRDHRVHHKYSETDADPHNSNRGFFFSHVGWLLTRKHPDVIDKGNKIDMSDITSDPLLEWHRKYFGWLRLLICYILPVWIPMYFWNETFTYAFFSNTVRYVISLNATWSVNSFAHIWGYKPYDRRIQPVENVGVAILAMGEGWHNYHHAFPWDYRASEMGYRYNFTAFLIDQFAKIGWAYDLKKPSESLVATVAAKYGEVPRRVDQHHHCTLDQSQIKKSS